MGFKKIFWEMYVFTLVTKTFIAYQHLIINILWKYILLCSAEKVSHTDLERREGE